MTMPKAEVTVGGELLTGEKIRLPVALGRERVVEGFA